MGRRLITSALSDVHLFITPSYFLLLQFVTYITVSYLTAQRQLCAALPQAAFLVRGTASSSVSRLGRLSPAPSKWDLTSHTLVEMVVDGSHSAVLLQNI